MCLLPTAWAKKNGPAPEDDVADYYFEVQRFDSLVGSVIAELERIGELDNTLIIFASDNGGNMYNEVDGTTATSNAPLRGGKATMYEGGVRVPTLVRWPGKVAAGSETDRVSGFEDWMPTIMEAMKNGYPFKIVGDPVFFEPLSVAIDKGDPEFGAKIAEIQAHVGRVSSGLDETITVLNERIGKIDDRFVELEGSPEVVQFSGGEPTIHPEFDRIFQYAIGQPFDYVMINTNGIRIAKDPVVFDKKWHPTGVGWGSEIGVETDVGRRIPKRLGVVDAFANGDRRLFCFGIPV